MKKLTAVLLILACAAALLFGAAGGENAEITEIGKLPDEVLVTFFDDTVFAGDSLVAMFQSYAGSRQKETPWFFGNITFKSANSYKLRFASYKTIPSEEMKYAHLVEKGKKVTLYQIVKNRQPARVFLLAGVNDALTTDYTKKRQGRDETGVERAVRYIRTTAEILREASPETVLYVVSQMPVTRSFVQGTNKAKACQERWDEINETLKGLSEEIGFRYVALDSGVRGEDGLLPMALSYDGKYHLNDDGNGIIARELLDYAQAEYEAGRWKPAAEAGAKEEGLE